MMESQLPIQFSRQDRNSLSFDYLISGFFYINFSTWNYNLFDGANFLSYRPIIESGSHYLGALRTRVLGIYYGGPQAGHIPWLVLDQWSPRVGFLSLTPAPAFAYSWVWVISKEFQTPCTAVKSVHYKLSIDDMTE